MTIRYQIVLLDPGATGRAGRLRATLEKRLRDLGLDPAEWVTFLDASSFASRDPKAPITAVYFGHKTRSPDETQAVEALLALPAVVFPVVEDLKAYSSLVPPALLPVNGLEIKPGDDDLEEVANLVLEALSLLRQNRRLFISYRRVESRAVATQLYDLLDERGYDVFLDTHGVRAGDQFQEVLWHRLADSDVVVLLDTPDFLGSQWTRQELAEASAMSIGILQVIWPGHRRDPVSELAIPFYLDKDADFAQGEGAEARLKEETLRRIATDVEGLRARSLAARHNNLVREVCLAAREAKVEAVVQPYRYILTRKGSGSVAIIPAVGVPTAQQIQQIEILLDPSVPPHASRSVLVYDHRGIRDQWLKHLQWLDRHLPVKSFRVTDTSGWLAQL